MNCLHDINSTRRQSMKKDLQRDFALDAYSRARYNDNNNFVLLKNRSPPMNGKMESTSK